MAKSIADLSTADQMFIVAIRVARLLLKMGAGWVFHAAYVVSARSHDNAATWQPDIVAVGLFVAAFAILGAVDLITRAMCVANFKSGISTNEW